MKLWSRLKSPFRNLFRKPRVENQLDGEVRGYVDMMVDEHGGGACGVIRE
jgi:hypothetical protein